MGVRRVGQATYAVDSVEIISTAAVGGPKEGDGPLGQYFDRVWKDDSNGQKTFELAEVALLKESQEMARDKANIRWTDISAVLGGDLLDQIVSTNFAARNHGRPTLGLFSACAVFTEAVGLGAILVSAGGPTVVLASAVSHNLAAERQFRYPIELGYQRTPTASWTATAAGSAILGRGPGSLGITVESVTFGKVLDLGMKDPTDMGSAMAPAAFDTITQHLDDTDQKAADYDAIYTGDLGVFGLKLLEELARRERVPLGTVEDCGRVLYDLDRQDVHNGGSGAGCSASVFSGYLTHHLSSGKLRRILLVSTGALFSPTSYQQGQTIPCIAHAVSIRRKEQPV